jgi:hypothetical protein
LTVAQVWAAQRCPDDHVTAIGNQFIIRKVFMPFFLSFIFSFPFQVNLTDAENFLASNNLLQVAKVGKLRGSQRRIRAGCGLVGPDTGRI